MSDPLKPKQRFKLLEDDDGHYYVIPVEKEDQFRLWLDDLTEPDGTDFGDPDYSLGCSPLCVTFENPQW